MPKYKRVDKLELQHRLSKIMKLIAEKPTLTYKEIIQIVTNQYGISQRQAYRYLSKINILYEDENLYRMSQQKNKSVAQLIMLFEKALAMNNVNCCLGIIREINSIYGLTNNVNTNNNNNVIIEVPAIPNYEELENDKKINCD